MSRLGSGITVDQASLRRVAAAVSNRVRETHRQVSIAANQALADTQRFMGQAIQGKVRVPQRVIREQISVSRMGGSAKAEVGAVILRPSARIPLKDFGARQVGKRDYSSVERDERGRFNFAANARGGVTYRIGQQGGRSFLPAGFMIERFGNNVFVRADGASRLPLRKPKGVSPWGVAVVNHQVPEYTAHMQASLNRRLADRARFLELRASGVIPGGRV